MKEMTKDEFATEFKRNLEAFSSMPADWVLGHKGKIALFAEGEFKNTYNDMSDAYKIGCQQFGEGRFVLQRVGAPPIDLGIISCFLQPDSSKGKVSCLASSVQ